MVELYKWYKHEYDSETVYYAVFFNHRNDTVNSFSYVHESSRGWLYEGISNMNQDPQLWEPAESKVPGDMLKFAIQDIFIKGVK